MQTTLAPAPQPAAQTDEPRGLSPFARALGPYRRLYRMDELAATMRKMAAGTPGAQIPHVIVDSSAGGIVITILILTCHGDEWTLRILCADRQRPVPQSAAETEWVTFVNARREQFSVPQAAVMQWDGPERCKGAHICAVTLRWTEVEQSKLI